MHALNPFFCEAATRVAATSQRLHLFCTVMHVRHVMRCHAIMFELCMHDPIMSSQDLRLVSCHGQGFEKRSGMCMHFIMHVIFGCSAGSHSLSHSNLQQQQAATTTTSPLMCHARSQFLSCQVKSVCPCELHGPDM